MLKGSAMQGKLCLEMCDGVGIELVLLREQLYQLPHLAFLSLSAQLSEVVDGLLALGGLFTHYKKILNLVADLRE